MDNHMALEPDEMKNLVETCKNIFLGLGPTKRILSKKEILQKKKMRRSIFVNKNLKKGQKIKNENIDLKRPGTGITVNNLDKVLNKKLIKNIREGQFLTKHHFKK